MSSSDPIVLPPATVAPQAPGKLRDLMGLAARFGLAGLANTAIGFAIIETLDIGFGVKPFIANACGYGIGIGVGFVLNHGFVFRYQGARPPVARYLVMAIVAFAANQAVLAIAHHLLGPSPMMRTLAQLAGMGTYTLLTFVLCRLWVFTHPKPAVSPAPN
jgi:putative flippase GtrA